MKFTFHVESLTFGNASTCTYCGEPAEGTDHVIAYSFQTLMRRRLLRHFGPCTFACGDCNSHLSNRYFDTFAERCRFASNRLTSKAAPDLWTEEELAILDPSLSGYIRRYRCRHQLLRLRAGWLGSRDFLLNIENLEWLKIPKRYSAYFSDTLASLKLLGASWKPSFASVGIELKNASGASIELPGSISERSHQ